MSPDEPIDLVPTEKAYELPDDLSVVRAGDIVQVGKGKRRWTVKDFWQPARGGVLANLTIDGYVNQSVEVGRLTVVERPNP
ncbi:hypothetical protein [Terrabacter terrigena]|uniref:Uncharacterized protein n=1 Tax=Terrabacter terrigena TaxID=574718 RepID=A0ABW3N163_9MICO